ncbi:glycosyltransferase [Ilumatobacter sp.]|uniref:glycosyltransferase n=1 Tax=Ilumatobacter sp. TaxID=1967498 RepID=UPI003B51D81E
MEAPVQSAPPVVAVVVVHDPGDWFAEVVDAMADQDYPNLRLLFLVAGEGADDDVDAVAEQVEALVAGRFDTCFVRSLGANPGFGPAANEVLRLVEGENGFFLFCHDDVAPDRDAVRLMVEELYRSNAGVVGPKLVDWDDPGVLLQVGLGLDRFGQIDQAIEPDEVDQEQHDGVRDVFVVPSACMLARADLFRELGGFDPAIDLHGESVEFCWRVHHSGARVVVAPSARVRHRADLESRRDDLNHPRLEARHRLRTLATMTGAARLPVRLLELTVLTLVEVVVGLFSGRLRQGLASARALVGLIPRAGAIASRRRRVRDLRRVPEREVIGLQQRGSARLSSFLRSRDTTTYVGADSNVRRWRESTTAPVLAWIAVLVLLAIGARRFFAGGLPEVGQFLPFPESPRDLLEGFARGWNPTGGGSTSPNPTGWAVLSVLSVGTLLRMGLLQTAFALGLVVVGLIGLWRTATVFPSTRARVAALVVYAASPLVGGAFALGSLDVLVTYAAVPWVVHTLRLAVGVETADPRIAESDVADAVIELGWPERIRRTVQLAVVIGLGAAFEPAVAAVAAVVGMTMAVATLIALAPWRTALDHLGVTAAALAGAAVLNLPWITSWEWAAIAGAPPVGDPGRGLADLAAFRIAPITFAALCLAWYVPVVAAVLLARAWRLTWAVRAGFLVVVFGFLAVLADRSSLPVAAPAAGILLVPVALGVAISAAAALAAFDLDVRGGSFGWRQPLGIAASAAVVVGLVPGVLAVGPGDWDAPTTPLLRLVQTALPDVPEDDPAHYRVLYLGDARLLPTPAVEYRDGVSFALSDDADLDVRSTWSSPGELDATVVGILDQIALGSTQRAGQLLAPLGVRYIVIPQLDGVVSTSSEPLPLPVGLVEAFDDQLDIVADGLPTVEMYRNASWMPTLSLLEGPTAEASRSAGDEALVRADLGSVRAIATGADSWSSDDVRFEVEPGVVHLAVPFDDRWRLEVGGGEVVARPAFGLTTAFDVGAGGVATLSYDTASSRTALLVLQLLLWAVALYTATRVELPFARRRRRVVTDETLITIDAEVDRGFEDAVGAGASIPAVATSTGGEPDPAGIDPPGDRAGAPADGIIDELPWVDDLIEEVEDPIGVVPERVDGPSDEVAPGAAPDTSSDGASDGVSDGESATGAGDDAPGGSSEIQVDDGGATR